MPVSPSQRLANISRHVRVGLACGAILLMAAAGPALSAIDDTSGVAEGLETAAPGEAISPLAIGGSHACALPGDGSVRCWGGNFWGQLGDGTTSDSDIPVAVIDAEGSVSPLVDVVAVAAGSTHTCAVLEDTTVRCWGDNGVQTDPVGEGQGGHLGNGTTDSSLTPVAVIAGAGSTEALTDVVAITAGQFRTCALVADGTVMCWGNGQTAPLAVTTAGGEALSGVIAISSANFHDCALLADNTVACWGSNNSGELGDGTVASDGTPVTVIDSAGALSNVDAIAAGGGFNPMFGGGHSCALRQDGTVACWGNNDLGQIGDGHVTDLSQVTAPVTTPAQVIAGAGSTSPLSGVTAIAAGWDTCALLADTTVLCWGGAPTAATDFAGTPLSGVTAIASGGYGTCAVMADLTVACWTLDQPAATVPGLLVDLPTPDLVATPEPAPAVTGEPAPDPTGDSNPTETTASPAADGVAGPSEADPGTTVTFRDSVPTPAEITLDPVIVAQSLLIAAAIVLFVPFPGVLFNSTLEANYPEVVGRVRAGRRRLRAIFALIPLPARRAPTVSVDPDPALDIGGAPGAVATGPDSEKRPKPEFWTTLRGVTLFLSLTALLGSFLDPTFGPDTQSLATFLGLTAGLIVTLAAFGLPVAFTFRRSAIPFLVRALPGTLIVGVACVLISRLTDFQPGYLYGLVIGVAARELSVAAPPRTVAIGTATTLVVALLAWVALLFVAPLASVTDAGLGILALQTALATVLVAGLEGVFFGMLPVRFLPGETVFSWNRRVWAALFGIATLGFLLIVMNPASGYLADGTRTPMFTILALLLFFGIGSVAFWAYFRFRRPPAIASATP